MRSVVSCRTPRGKVGEPTEDLIRAPETKGHFILGHQFSILLTTFASHFDCQWVRQIVFPGDSSEVYVKQIFSPRVR